MVRKSCRYFQEHATLIAYSNSAFGDFTMSINTWLPISGDSHFSLANIPFGIVSRTGSTSRFPATRIGDYVLDLRTLGSGGAFSQFESPRMGDFLSGLGQETLNAFAGLGREFHGKIRAYLQELLKTDTALAHLLRDNESLKAETIIQVQNVQVHLPLTIGDYTDFYAGKNHAYNVGVLFRGPQNALQPNYTHLPVGYHGRASTVVVSGTPIRRPRGQILPDPTNPSPIYAASKKLDIELELAAFICKENAVGDPVHIQEAQEYVFGYVLMNDWSARDVQAWEYVPLGPFNSKNFGTTISPWVVLADALEPFRSPTMNSDNQERLLPYLRGSGSNIQAHDISLTVEIECQGARHVVTKTNSKNLLYSFEQMVAHHTVTGCALRVGDLLGSGTISGPTPESRGSFLEITDNGKTPVQFSTSSGTTSRMFLEDGDKIVITGVAGHQGAHIGFGECEGNILPAHKH